MVVKGYPLAALYPSCFFMFLIVELWDFYAKKNVLSEPDISEWPVTACTNPER